MAIINQLLVSVGIPTYNRPEELRRTLEGIVSQTYQNLEIIVSDNATPDDLVTAIVHKFMESDSRIHYFRQPENFGAIFNFQFVLDKANGEYFMWAADDDYRELDFVERLIEQLSLNPESVIAFCDFEAVDENGVKLERYPPFFPFLCEFTSKNSFLRLMRFFLQLETKGKANIIYGLIKREALKDFSWDQFHKRYGWHGLDMLFVFSLLCKGKLALSEKKLYRCTVGNIKEYISVVQYSFGKRIVMQFDELIVQLRYSLQYLYIAKGWLFVALLICWPIKVVDITIRMFLIAKINSLFKKVRRYF